MALAQGAVRGHLNWLDLQGNNAKNAVYLKGATLADKQTALSNLQDSLNTITVATCNTGMVSIEMEDSTPSPASAGPYENVEDKAVFIFYSVNNERVRLEVPGPSDGIFETDKETVDQLDAAVIALLTVIIASITDKLGGAIIGIYKAYRKRSKLRQ